MTADVSFKLGENTDGIFTAHSQEVSPEFLDGLKDYKAATANQKCREFHRVASIPVVFVHKWLREGFNVYTEPMKEIVKKLHAEGLTAFLTTEKKVA